MRTDNNYYHLEPGDAKLKCDICGQTFISHIHRHEGHVLHLYGNATCCNGCWEGNWDGWNSTNELRTLQIIKEKGLNTPPRNQKGLLPRN